MTPQNETMVQDALTGEWVEADRFELLAGPAYEFDFSRRSFIKVLGAGLLLTVVGDEVLAQAPGGEGKGGRRGGGGGGNNTPASARLHIDETGLITVMTGKVEIGQGARTNVAMATAEELRVPLSRIRVVMADTSLTPDDGGTHGSQTTPRTIPAVRRAAGTAREMLVTMACERWKCQPGDVGVEDGVIARKSSDEKITYGELAKTPEFTSRFMTAGGGDAALTPVSDWRILGRTHPRPNLDEVVMGKHQYPSDVRRPGMVYGKVLRPPSYGATLESIDTHAVSGLDGVVAVRDGNFAGCVAPNSFLAAKGVEALAATAKWQEPGHLASHENLYTFLKEKAGAARIADGVEKALGAAASKLEATYTTAYIQHVPMEPRAAVAEWEGEKLTVWTGTSNPRRVQGEITDAFRIGNEQVRVISPDTGCSFGGKHSGEAALEAARLAKACGKPVSLRWTRAEEMTWAYFRPAAVIDVRAALGADNKLTAWDFVNINSGNSGINTPYTVVEKNTQYLQVENAPLRHGSYRTLAATANHFARESMMDELAHVAKIDPLEFRLAHLENGRLRDVLEAAARAFDWKNKKSDPDKRIGYGLACGTEKGSFVAGCVEVEVDRQNKIHLRRICQAYDCGKVLNPQNLRAQIEGAIVMGLGAVLSEEMEFENGKIANATLAKYHVPRFKDVPIMDIVMLDKTDQPSVGAGETPIVTVAPAVANAVFAITGQRLRSLPLKMEKSEQA